MTLSVSELRLKRVGETSHTITTDILYIHSKQFSMNI